MGRGWRRLRMGFQTVTGLARRGFFAPYRYAGEVRPARRYAELEPLLEAAAQAMQEIGAVIEEHAELLGGFAGPPPEPRWEQSWFPRLDGAAAWAMVQEHGPRRIVEVGSGHSTRFLARALRDLDQLGGLTARGLGGTRGITSIDPAPRADIAGLTEAQHREVLGEGHMHLFTNLRAGDIAFFDSSHLLWPGTDVDMILNRILPALAPGVLVHIHDIFLPDPYPEAWGWRGYTEQNGLGGWLAGPMDILWSSHYARTRLGAADWPGIAGLPLPEGAHETSLWLRKRGE